MIVSIVTVCFNDLSGLKRTADSIGALMAGETIEWIVIDGGSSDGTVAFIKECSFIDKWVSEPDGGIYDAMNKGTALASGEYVQYLNAGDQYCSGVDFEKVIDLLQGGVEVLLCGANFRSGNSVKYRAPRDISASRYSVPANHQAILFKRSVLGPSPYNKEYKVCGDYDLCTRLYAQNVSALKADFPFVIFELGGTSTFRIFTLAREAAKIQVRNLDLNFFYVAYSFCVRILKMSVVLAWFKLNS